MNVSDVLGVLDESIYDARAEELAAGVRDPDFWLKKDGMYFARDRHEISMAGWAARREVRAYWILDQTQFPGFWLSTVWLGMDHGFGRGEPIIFESTLFEGNPEVDGLDDSVYSDRYCTEQQALKGHSDICRKIRSGWKWDS